MTNPPADYQAGQVSTHGVTAELGNDGFLVSTEICSHAVKLH